MVCPKGEPDSIYVSVLAEALVHNVYALPDDLAVREVQDPIIPALAVLLMLVDQGIDDHSVIAIPMGPENHLFDVVSL